MTKTKHHKKINKYSNQPTSNQYKFTNTDNNHIFDSLDRLSSFQIDQIHSEESSFQQSIEIDEIPLIYHQMSKLNKKINKMLSWRKRQIKNRKIQFKRLIEEWIRQNVEYKQCVQQKMKLSRYSVEQCESLNRIVKAEDYYTIGKVKNQNIIQNDQKLNIKSDKRRLKSLSNKNICQDILLKQQYKKLSFMAVNRSQIIQQLQTLPHGCFIYDQNTLVIWNYQYNIKQKLLYYLQNSPKIQHIIVQHAQIITTGFFEHLNMPWLLGIYIFCQFQLNKKEIKVQKLKYFSLLPTNKFIDLTDRYNHFPRSAQKIVSYENKKSKIQNFKLWECNTIRNISISSDRLKKLNEEIQQLTVINDSNCIRKIRDNSAVLKISHCLKLQSLTFTTCKFMTQIPFKSIFSSCKNLHTFVLDKCSGPFKEIVDSMQQMNSNQMKHLGLIGDNTNYIQINGQQLLKITQQKQLRTLILEYVIFKQNQNHVPFSRKQKSQLRKIFLRNIKKLTNLTHLNYNNSFPVEYLIQAIKPPMANKIKVLNLARTNIKKYLINYLKNFNKLQSLSISYTSITSDTFIKITQNMPQLQELSIQGMNGKKSQSNLMKIYKFRNCGEITIDSLEKMKHKNLKYVNIYGCKQLQTYQWKDFLKLECIRIQKGPSSKELISKLENRNITIVQQLRKEQIAENDFYIEMQKDLLSLQRRENGLFCGETESEMLNRRSCRLLKANLLKRGIINLC